MNQLEILRESLGQCDEIILDALIMRNRIVEDIMAYKEATDSRFYSLSRKRSRKNGWRREWKVDAIRTRFPMYLNASAQTVNGSRQENSSTTTSC